MATANYQRRVGPLLREWRERRRRTQLDLALDAGISPRHLSFVETGRANPSPEMVLLLAKQLEVPFRERNRLLLAAGHAPSFPERSLEDPELTPVREALQLILTGHEPYPAVVFDRAWNVVAANAAMAAFTEGVDPALLTPPINVLRIGLHPRGMAPKIINLSEWRAHFLERLQRQIAATANEDLIALFEEVANYPAPPPEHQPDSDPGTGQMLGPVRLRAADGGELSFFGMFATFDTPFEVTTSELAMEVLFPADPATAQALSRVSPSGASDA
jgi:transcriptional regulator with XRE-family HTH domain